MGSGSLFRIALANLRMPGTPEESVTLAVRAVEEAAERDARVLCFPECFIPGYRLPGVPAPPPNPAFLDRALVTVASAVRQAGLTVVLGMERVTDQGLLISACVLNPDGSVAGWQDKGQLDPSEEQIYPVFSEERHLFTAGSLTFGVVICHEGWRYPETVRWAAQRGAQVVFHPHVHPPEPGDPTPVRFADPANSFHEKAMLCRAAENTCYFASVNCAIPGSGTTSAVANPDGTLHSFQPHGVEGLLIADLDLTLATGLLARRCRRWGYD